jgi:hypothetical protein
LSALYRSFVAMCLVVCLPVAAFAQPVEPHPDEPEPTEPATQQSAADFDGSLQVVHGPSSGNAPKEASIEIFPDASRVWLHVADTKAAPVERARRGDWICGKNACSATTGTMGQSTVGDSMLLSIKVRAPTMPLPLTIWGRKDANGKPQLDFDPVLLDQYSYRALCTYKPLVQDNPASPPQGAPAAPAPAQPGDGGAGPAATPANPANADITKCDDAPGGPPVPVTPDAAQIVLGMQWPDKAELADFRYLAIVDTCGDARVMPFQRTFSVPVVEIASGGCGAPNGQELRVFPQGGYLRVTAFNIDAPATGDVMNVTYRVTMPALENLEESNPARLLFPDIMLKDLRVDCGPPIRKAPTDKSGAPMPPPVPPGVPPGKGPNVPVPPGKGPPPTPKEPDPKPSGPSSRPLDHGSVVIAPEPLRLGNCRITLGGQTKRRLVAPLALYVQLVRTDVTNQGTAIELLPANSNDWIITPNAAEYPLPALKENFDGDSRLKLIVSSDPLSGSGKVVLFSDAARVASSLRAMGAEANDVESARRVIGSVTIHSVPLCGKSNFESLDEAGNCIRGYLTVPAMLATLQITRFPWVEKPLITRSVLSAVGLAFAFDSYDPVERRAFPIAGQIGGFVEQLGDGRTGLMAYAGVAPTLPILGSGGNTTSLGFLAGIGVNYITNENGPDEGLKPTAFISFVVQVGQANPETSISGRSSFGTYAGN